MRDLKLNFETRELEIDNGSLDFIIGDNTPLIPILQDFMQMRTDENGRIIIGSYFSGTPTDKERRV